MDRQDTSRAAVPPVVAGPRGAGSGAGSLSSSPPRSSLGGALLLARVATREQAIFAAFAQPAAITTEADVAEAVWRAANDSTGTLRFPAGADAVALARSA